MVYLEYKILVFETECLLETNHTCNFLSSSFIVKKKEKENILRIVNKNYLLG